ncbi:MAG: hypothetical protein A2Z37_16715 [Chloroflexi bacterium RBG_19FT_COMBO_62_14]|nr:MAG: hypothetical protein A2Z37_16715 [Chloroflexi bacterium RBG_19FT_COMBO_62_14]
MKQKVEDYVVTNTARGEMLSRAAVAVHVREFPPVVSDEPPARGGENRGPSPLEYVLISLCACTNVSAGRMAEKLRFEYENLETYAEGVLDTRGRRGLADVPVHYKAVRLRVRIKTSEPDERLARLKELVSRYSPVDSLIRAAVPDYVVAWERMD